MDWRIFGGSSVLKTFSDTLLRSSGSALGSPWVIGFSDPTQVGWFSATGGIFCNNTVGLTLKNPTGGGSHCNIPIIPVTALAWTGKNQFSEAVISASAGAAAIAAGPSVGYYEDATAISQNGYFLEMTQINTVNIRLNNPPTFTLIQNNIASWAVSDKFRISVVWSAASNLVSVLKNGTAVAGSPFTDSNALRPLASFGGLPGIYFEGMATNNSISFKNFRCGLGTGS